MVELREMPYRTPCPPREAPFDVDVVAVRPRGAWRWLASVAALLAASGVGLGAMSWGAARAHDRIAREALERTRCEAARQAAREAWHTHARVWRGAYSIRFPLCLCHLRRHGVCDSDRRSLEPCTRPARLRVVIAKATRAAPAEAWSAARTLGSPVDVTPRYRGFARGRVTYRLALARSWYAYLACTPGPVVDARPPRLLPP